MYEKHFGLSEPPFGLTPNTRYFLRAPSHADAIELLQVALREREGFIKVTGEVGTGKTLLCRLLLNTLTRLEKEKGGVATAYIPNPSLAPAELYEAVADELSVPLPEAVNNHRLLKALNTDLIRRARLGQRVVLVIDEAQSMPEETLEALRLLTNLETESERLLQVVLFGQPELDETLSRSNLRQLSQRITFSHWLQPLDSTAVSRYLQHRLTRAGYDGAELFEASAVKQLARASGGVPRLLNILAHKCLLAAWGEGAVTVNRGHAIRAIRDTSGLKTGRILERWL